MWGREQEVPLSITWRYFRASLCTVFHPPDQLMKNDWTSLENALQLLSTPSLAVLWASAPWTSEFPRVDGGGSACSPLHGKGRSLADSAFWIWLTQSVHYRDFDVLSEAASTSQCAFYPRPVSVNGGVIRRATVDVCCQWGKWNSHLTLSYRLVNISQTICTSVFVVEVDPFVLCHKTCSKHTKICWKLSGETKTLCLTSCKMLCVAESTIQITCNKPAPLLYNTIL